MYIYYMIIILLSLLLIIRSRFGAQGVGRIEPTRIGWQNDHEREKIDRESGESEDGLKTDDKQVNGGTNNGKDIMSIIRQSRDSGK